MELIFLRFLLSEGTRINLLFIWFLPQIAKPDRQKNLLNLWQKNEK